MKPGEVENKPDVPSVRIGHHFTMQSHRKLFLLLDQIRKGLDLLLFTSNRGSFDLSQANGILLFSLCLWTLGHFPVMGLSKRFEKAAKQYTVHTSELYLFFMQFIPCFWLNEHQLSFVSCVSCKYKNHKVSFNLKNDKEYHTSVTIHYIS